MPISLSSKKSLRKALKNQKKNGVVKKNTKKIIKSFLAKPSQELLNKVFEAIDKAVKNHIFHKNKAKRIRSRLSKKIGKIEVKTESVKKAKKMK